MYFEVDGFNLHTHAIRRSIASSLTWVTFHLPFIMSYTLAGSALSKLVLAHDCGNANPENLDDGYFPDLKKKSRWAFGGSTVEG